MLWCGRRSDASNGRFAPGGWTRFDDPLIPNQALTRRCDPHRSDCWLIYFSDIHVGTIARAVGTPNATTQWKWHVGFYPGSNPGEQCWGTTATFDEARAQFERAWMVFSANRTEADYEAWRKQQDWTSRKYAAIDRGEKVPVVR